MTGLAQEASGPLTAVPGLNLQANVAVNVQYTAKDDLLAGTEKFAQGASKVTEINLDPSTMGMMGESHGPDAKLANKMKMMTVHTYQYDKPGMYRTEDVEAYAKKLQDGSWSCPIVTREKDRFTYICSKTDSDHETNEMVIFSADPQKITFIHMAGTMSLNDLTQMSGSAKELNRRVTPPTPRFKMSPEPPIPPTPPEPAQHK
jgi:Domain of unknown function (DUF4252)